MRQYFISYFLHNKENDGWAYKIVGEYSDIGLAKKAYHSELASYIGGTVYDSVTVTLTDSYGNKIASEHWKMAEESATEG